MVIEQCAEKIVCRCDGVHIACEVQVDVLHRDYLSISAACCAALDAEHGTERGLTESEYSPFAYLCHSLGKTYGNGGLALACGGGVDGGNEYQLAVGLICSLSKKLFGKLCLVMTVRLYIVLRNTE